MKRIIVLFATIVVVVALWSGGWLYLSGQIREQVARLAEPGDPSMPSLTCADFSVGGYPFSFDLTCTSAAIAQGDVSLDLPGIKAAILVYRPMHVLFSFKGPLRYSDAFYGSQMDFRWARLQASARLENWRIARVSAQAENLEYIDALVGETLLLSTPLAEAHLIDVPEKFDAATGLATVALHAFARDLAVPGQNITGGSLIADAEIDRLPGDIRSLSGSSLLRDWQGAGGRLALTKFEASAPGIGIALSGNLGLTANGLPEGDMWLVTRGLSERLQNNVSAQWREILLGSRKDDGSHEQIVTIRQGAVIAGFAPVALLPPLF